MPRSSSGKQRLRRRRAGRNEEKSLKDYVEHYIKDNQEMDYSQESRFFRCIDEYRFRLIRRFLSPLKGRILDIGSGSGRMLENESARFFSLDISQLNNESRLPKTEGDASGMPFRDSSFAGAVLSEVLEHIVSPKEALLEANRILEEGGRLLLTVPYRERIKMHLCIHCNALTPENAHLHSFDEKTLSKLLQECGFGVKKVLPFENRILYSLHFFSVFRKMPIDFINLIDIIVGTWYNKYNKLLLIAEKRASGSVGRAHPSQG